MIDYSKYNWILITIYVKKKKQGWSSIITKKFEQDFLDVEKKGLFWLQNDWTGRNNKKPEECCQEITKVLWLPAGGGSDSSWPGTGYLNIRIPAHFGLDPDIWTKDPTHFSLDPDIWTKGSDSFWPGSGYLNKRIMPWPLGIWVYNSISDKTVFAFQTILMFLAQKKRASTQKILKNFIVNIA